MRPALEFRVGGHAGISSLICAVHVLGDFKQGLLSTRNLSLYARVRVSDDQQMSFPACKYAFPDAAIIHAAVRFCGCLLVVGSPRWMGSRTVCVAVKPAEPASRRCIVLTPAITFAKRSSPLSSLHVCLEQKERWQRGPLISASCGLNIIVSLFRFGHQSSWFCARFHSAHMPLSGRVI